MIGSNAAKLAEVLQLQTYAARGKRPPDWATRRDWFAENASRIYDSQPQDAVGKTRSEYINESLAEFDRLLRARPTRYENPVTYGMLENLAREIKEAAAQGSDRAPEWPLLATLPSGQVNAQTMRVPSSGEHVILFDNSLFTFAHLLSKAVLRTVPLAVDHDGQADYVWREDAIAERITSNSELQYRLFQVVAEYVLTGNPLRAEPYLVESRYANTAEDLSTSMELFALGHEYGHILAGHLDAPDVLRLRLQEVEAEAIEFGWPRELEADHIGSRLSMRANRVRAIKSGHDIGVGQAYCGADFYFTASDIVQRAVTLVRHGDETARVSHSHPPPQVRRHALRVGMLEVSGIEMRGDSVEFAEYEQIMKLPKILEFAAERLWEKIRPAIISLPELGARELPTFEGNLAQMRAIWRQTHGGSLP